ncbi:hypothetical protein SNEBB_008302 [Seison nebaliae]|nr:hypothetical protein SNEBB_008302 [Seison nebaliae]
MPAQYRDRIDKYFNKFDDEASEQKSHVVDPDRERYRMKSKIIDNSLPLILTPRKQPVSLPFANKNRIKKPKIFHM